MPVVVVVLSASVTYTRAGMMTWFCLIALNASSNHPVTVTDVRATNRLGDGSFAVDAVGEYDLSAYLSDAAEIAAVLGEGNAK